MSRHTVKKMYQHKHISIQIAGAESHILSNIIDADTPNYHLGSMIKIKNTLNDAKSSLDVYYELARKDAQFGKQFMKFQNIVDLYKPMRIIIENNSNALHVTNAWLKYWEIYIYYDLVPSDVSNDANNDTFKVFFNAELPGAAVCAFNHYMKTMRRAVKFDWKASSLAPGEPTSNVSEALGDTYGIFANNRDHWLMTLPNEAGARRNNGDVTVLANILDFAEQIGPNSPYGGVDLYSHDAGIDVSNDFNNQELINAKIHFGCALACFKTLKLGGSFTAKQYTFFETFTWNLICIYAVMFDEFYICKPLTSRPYNSEIYLIGKGFRGIHPTIDGILMRRLGNFNTKPLLDDNILKYMPDTVKMVEDAAAIIFGQQTDILNENVRLFKTYERKLSALQNGLKELKRQRINSWLSNYPVPSIDSRDQLPSNA
jgi:hypothetical protein